MYYSVIGILAILILLIENEDVLFSRNHTFENASRTVYRRFLFAVLAYYFTDIFWGTLEYYKMARLLFLDTSLYFIAMAAGVLFWTQYAVTYLNEHNAFGRVLIYSGRIFAAAVTVLVGINFFYPLLFTVDEACVYRPQSVRYVVLVVQILMLLLISVYATVSIMRHRPGKPYRYRTLALFGLIMAVFLFGQLWFPYLPLYAIAYMLGTCLLHAFVVGDEKEEFRRELKEATMIAELRQSITSLLDNMPIMSFSKDVETGSYLACNQAFAEYAHKASPTGVVGLTDFEIFDHATATHFVEDDRKALDMDEPYILYEDVADAAGNPRQFQTTKLKFYDAAGRLCLLGMSADITEMVRVKKENEQTKVAYQKALNESAVYENIVGALSEDYFVLYYVDAQTDEYVKYNSTTESESPVTESHGVDFFEACQKDAAQFIYGEDLDEFITMMNKNNLLAEITKHGVFRYHFRLWDGGNPVFVDMKAKRASGDDRHIIIGITNEDAQVRERMAADRAKEERKAYLRLNALNRNLLALYIVDPDNELYTEYNATRYSEELSITKHGNHFFRTIFQDSLQTVHPDDRERFQSLVTKENMLGSIKQDGVFVLDYRFLKNNLPIYVRLKASEIEEDGKARLIVGVEDIDAQIRQEQKYVHDLSAARRIATRDALTGVKNKYAFGNTQKELNEQIQRQEGPLFAIVICDINNLKNINDTKGHQAGDVYLRKACATICDIFKRSSVFRVGGDEFAVICQGHDYDHIDELLEEMNAANSHHTREGDVQIAFGMARFENDQSVDAVFERADQQMYHRKRSMKA